MRQSESQETGIGRKIAEEENMNSYGKSKRLRLVVSSIAYIVVIPMHTLSPKKPKEHGSDVISRPLNYYIDFLSYSLTIKLKFRDVEMLRLQMNFGKHEYSESCFLLFESWIQL
jgi:hypothetical protein